MLYVVKSTAVIAIAFLVMIFAIIPIRSFLLPRIFTKDELVVLDGDDEEIEEYLADKETTEVIMGSDDGLPEKNVVDKELTEDDNSFTVYF